MSSTREEKMIETFLKQHHDSVIFVLPMIVTIAVLIFSLIVIGYIKNRLKKPLRIICNELYRFMKYGVYLTLVLLGLEIVFKLLMPTYFVRLHQFAGIFILTALLLGYINAVINQLYVWQQAKLRKDNKRGQITQLNGIKHVSKVILSLVVLISVLDYLELPITGLLAGLGAGTFAAAIAMQDVIRNLFGGLVLLSVNRLLWAIISVRYRQRLKGELKKLAGGQPKLLMMMAHQF